MLGSSKRRDKCVTQICHFHCVLYIKINVKKCLSSWAYHRRRFEGGTQMEKGTWTEIKRRILCIKGHMSKLEIYSDGFWAYGVFNYRLLTIC